MSEEEVKPVPVLREELVPILHPLFQQLEWEQRNRNLLGYMCWLNSYVGGFDSIEKNGKATNSEIRRWIKNGSIQINGQRPTDIEFQIEFPITDLVLFPKGGKRKKTLL